MRVSASDHVGVTIDIRLKQPYKHIMDISYVINRLKDACANVGHVVAFGEEHAFTLVVHFRYDDDPYEEIPVGDDVDDYDKQYAYEQNYRRVFTYHIAGETYDIEGHVMALIDKCKSLQLAHQQM